MHSNLNLARHHTLRQTRQRGFNLIEMAIVLVILGVLIGGLITPLSTQFDTSRRTGTEAQLKEIHDALLGFVAANGRLPCPATAASNGLAAPNVATAACTSNHGFVPARTLGLNGSTNANSLLLDPWLNPIRYSVSTASGGDLTNDIDLNTTADFRICEEAACANIIADTVAAVIFSQAQDTAASADQLENTDGDITFVDRGISEAVGGEFDDQVYWLSPSVIYFHLVKAGQLD